MKIAMRESCEYLTTPDIELTLLLFFFFKSIKGPDHLYRTNKNICKYRIIITSLYFLFIIG